MSKHNDLADLIANSCVSVVPYADRQFSSDRLYETENARDLTENERKTITDALQAASTNERGIEMSEHEEIIRDARRYRRLQILGCAVFKTSQLEAGVVSRFSGLDSIVDDDLRAAPNRGEAAPIPTAQDKEGIAATSNERAVWLPSVIDRWSKWREADQADAEVISRSDVCVLLDEIKRLTLHASQEKAT